MTTIGRASNRGFTLLELLIVVVIIAVAGGVAMVSFGGLFTRGPVRDAARKSTFLIRYARDLALARKTSQSITIDAETGTIFLDGPRNANEADFEREFALELGMKFCELNSPALRVVPKGDRTQMTLQFSYFGTCTGGSWVIRKDDFGIKMVCDEITGDVHVSEVIYDDE